MMAIVVVMLALGANGIIVQTLLLRELLVLGGGNEFSLGITLGGWLLAAAVGALLAGRSPRLAGGATTPYVIVTLLFGWCFPVALVLARSWKLLLGIPPELGIGLGQVTLAALAVLVPAAALHGWLFVAGCGLYGRLSARPTTAAGSGYLLTTLGTLAGGLLAAFLLIPFSPPLLAAGFVLLLDLMAVGLLWWRNGRPQTMLIASLLGGTALLGLALLTGGAARLEQWSLARQWPGQELVTTVNTPYQQLTVVRSGEQLTFFSDGLLLFPVPDPDLVRVEEAAHFPLLAHPAPRRVLVLGGGAGGVIAEILKHPSVTVVDYVEPDPWLLRLVARHAAPLTARELGDPRVRRFETDARRFVREARTTYDVVLLGTPLPLTLQGNRLFTAEFFGAVRRLLAADGLLAVGAQGSLTYYGPALGRLQATLQATLRQALPAVAVVPGDENCYLAGLRPVNLDPALLSRRLEERRLKVALLSPDYLAQRLAPAPREWFDRTIGPLPPELNLDAAPRLLLWHLGYRASQFDPTAGRLFGGLGGLGPAAVLAWAAGGALLLALTGRRRGRGVLGVIAVTGFAGMLLELVLVCAWQVLQGAMYQALALLITTFMAGLALGSWLANARLAAGRGARPLLHLTEAGMLATTALVTLAATLLPLAARVPLPLAAAVVLILLALVGLMVGGQFPLAVRLATADGSTSPAPTGTIYGADLLGAWLGGIIGGAVLLPALGMVPACLVVLILKAGSWLGLARSAGR